MAENDVTIQINLDAKDAQAAIELFGRESVKVLKNSESQIQSFGQAFSKIKVPVVAAIGAIIGAYQTMSAAIDQAVEDAKLTRQIEASLRATDEASSEAVKGILEFADAVKSATGVSDDLVKQTFITAKSFGITADEAKKLTQAAIDLAAATGIDTETAVRQLGGTLDGSIGKIGNLGAEFRNLTTAQLKAGDAIDLVTSKFGGTASKELDTYQGSTNSLKNAWDDLLKSFGRIVIESAIAKSAILGLANVLDSFTKSLEGPKTQQQELEQAISLTAALGGNIAKAVDSVLIAQEKIAFLGTGIGKQSKEVVQGFGAIIKSTEGSTKAILDFEDALASFPQKIIDPTKKTGKELEDLQNKAKKLAEQAKAFKEGIFGQFGSQIETEAFKAQQALLKLAEFQQKKAFSSKQAYEIRIRIVEDFNRKVEELNKASLEKQQKDAEEAALKARQNIEQAASDPIKFTFEKQTPFTKGEVAASVIGGLTMALKGRQGAIDLVSKSIGGVADVLLPGLGGAVAGLAQLLAQGPEATKKFIKEFIAAIPDIVQAISESIPVLVETLIDVLVNRGGAVRIAIAITKAMAAQPVWARIGKEIFGKSGNELNDSIRNGLTEGGTNIRDGFKDFFTNIGPSIASAGKSFGTDIQNSIKQAQIGFGPAIKKGFNEFISTISNFANQLTPALRQFIVQLPNAIYSALSGVFRELGLAISEPISKVFEPLKTATFELNQTILALFDPIERLIAALTGKDAKEGIKTAAQKIGDYLDARGFKPVTSGAATAEAIINPVIAANAIKKGFRMAQGGLVYAADGFMARGTDTVPAMLTPGELVVPRDMVGELAAFLQRQSPDSSGSDTAILAAILSAVQAPIVVKTEAKVNQNAFADIILQLNRQNARLRA